MKYEILVDDLSKFLTVLEWCKDTFGNHGEDERWVRRIGDISIHIRDDEDVAFFSLRWEITIMKINGEFCNEN